MSVERFDSVLTGAVVSGDHGFAEVMHTAIAGLLTDAELRAQLWRAAGDLSTQVGSGYLRRLRHALVDTERQVPGWQSTALDVLDGNEEAEAH